MMLYVFLFRSVCYFLYGPFCHGAFNLTIYIVYNIHYLNISLIYIVNKKEIKIDNDILQIQNLW